MKNLHNISFHCDDKTLTEQQIWHSRNVDYIYSCILAKNLAKSTETSKLNIYLSTQTLKHSLTRNGPIADARVPITFDEENFESQLSTAAHIALNLLGEAEEVNFDSTELLRQVELTNFVYHFYAAKRIPNSQGLKLRVTTRKGSLEISAELKDGSLVHLASLWPSPWLFLISHIGQSYDRDLNIDFRHSEIENPLFLTPYVDPSRCDRSWSRTLFIDDRNRKIERLSFRL